MSQKNPFDDLYDQISHLLFFVKEHSLVPSDELKVPPDLEKRLEKLRKKVDKFNKLSEEIVRMSDISTEELKMRQNGLSKEIPPEGQRLIQRGHEIKNEVQDYNDKLESILNHIPLAERAIEAKTDKPETRVLDDQQYAKKRRSKFKRFGSDQNWKPL